MLLLITMLYCYSRKRKNCTGEDLVQMHPRWAAMIPEETTGTST